MRAIFFIIVFAMGALWAHIVQACEPTYPPVQTKYCFSNETGIAVPCSEVSHDQNV